MSKTSELHNLRYSFSGDARISVHSRSGDSSSDGVDLWNYVAPVQSAEDDIIEEEEHAERRKAVRKFTRLLPLYFKKIFSPVEYKFFIACMHSDKTPFMIGCEMGIDYKAVATAILSKHNAHLPQFKKLMQLCGYHSRTLDLLPKLQKYLALSECKREYRETHKEQISEYKREYRATHKEQIAECTRKFRETHKEQLNAKRREDRKLHNDRYTARERARYAMRKEQITARKRAYREAHKEKFAEYQRKYYKTHKEQFAEYQRKYQAAHKEQIIEYQQKYKQTATNIQSAKVEEYGVKRKTEEQIIKMQPIAPTTPPSTSDVIKEHVQSISQIFRTFSYDFLVEMGKTYGIEVDSEAAKRFKMLYSAMYGALKESIDKLYKQVSDTTPISVIEQPNNAAYINN